MNNENMSESAKKRLEEARARGRDNRARLQEKKVVSDFLNKERASTPADRVLQDALAAERRKAVDNVMEDMYFAMADETGTAVVRKIKATTNVLFTILMRHTTSRPQMVTMLREMTAAMTLLASEVGKDLEIEPEADEEESK